MKKEDIIKKYNYLMDTKHTKQIKLHPGASPVIAVYQVTGFKFVFGKVFAKTKILEIIGDIWTPADKL